LASHERLVDTASTMFKAELMPL